MWQKFTEDARRAVFYSQEEAQRFGEGQVSTEHMLLGLLRLEDSASSRMLAILGLDAAEISREVIRSLPQPREGAVEEMVLTPRAKRVIDFSYDEARVLANGHIGSEHLLLGLIREADGLAGRVLAHFGAILDDARQAARQVQEGLANPSAPPLAVADADAMPLTLEAAAALGLMIAKARQAGRRAAAMPDLLNVLQEQPGWAAHYLLADLGPSAALAAVILARLPRGLFPPAGSFHLHPLVLAVLDLADRERALAGDSCLATHHLLLGILLAGIDDDPGTRDRFAEAIADIRRVAADPKYTAMETPGLAQSPSSPDSLPEAEGQDGAD